MSAVYKHFLLVLFRVEADRNFDKYIKTQDVMRCYFGLQYNITLS